MASQNKHWTFSYGFLSGQNQGKIYYIIFSPKTLAMLSQVSGHATRTRVITLLGPDIVVTRKEVIDKTDKLDKEQVETNKIP